MKYLRAWRIYAGYPTVSSFAHAAGITPGWLSELENPAGTQSPLLTTAHLLVRTLNKQLATPINAEDLLHAPPRNPALKAEAQCPGE